MGQAEDAEQGNGAAELLACLQDFKGRVVVVGLPPEGGLDPRTLKGRYKKDGSDGLLAALKSEFDQKLTVQSCAIAYHQDGKVVKGSIYVVAVVPTAEESDASLL